MTELSETERAQQQTKEEWLFDYDNAGDINKHSSPCIIELTPKIPQVVTAQIPEDIRNAGIITVRYAGDRLLINTDRHISKGLDLRIKTGIQRLIDIAEPDTGESLYEYSCYRTFMTDKRPFLALTFNEILTGSSAERYFNIELRNAKKKNFKTGNNGEFRIKGNTKRPQKGSFIKCWMDSVKYVPDYRPSHIHRYMNTMLVSAVFSCSNPTPHNGITKLATIEHEGWLYELP